MALPVSIRHLILFTLLQMPWLAQAACTVIFRHLGTNFEMYTTEFTEGVSYTDSHFRVFAEGADLERLRNMKLPALVCYQSAIDYTAGTMSISAVRHWGQEDSVEQQTAVVIDQK